MKNKLLIVPLIILFVILFFKTTKAFATPVNNPIFATIQVVQKMISEAISPIQNLLNNHEERIQNLESKVTELEERVKNLEVTPTPTSIPTPTLTPTPTSDLTPFEVQFSIVDAIDFDKGTAQANKLIKSCTYGSSSSGYNVPLDGNITETLCMTPELWGAQLLWIRVESFYGEVKSYGEPPIL